MRNVSGDILVDTNVLVYAYDPRDRAKQQRAIDALDRLIARRRAVLSVQCLSEFFNVVTRRLPEPMKREEALVRVERLARVGRILDLTPGVVLEGCRGATQHKLALWDALIWAAAKLNQITCVLTEDTPQADHIEGVRFLNPFAPDFDLKMLGDG